jgi:sugar phosphate isomerase/epimerase
MFVMIRRQFLKTGMMAVAGTVTFPDFLSAKPRYPKKLVGLQLYSVRDDMKADPLGTLKKLSGMGYKYVEHADYVNRKFYGFSASEFRKILDGLGLKMPSGHTVFTSKHWDESRKDFTDAWKYTIEDAATCGQKSGMKFGYHNHDFEFSQKLDGQQVFDLILSNTDPKLVMQQLDIGNMYNGGADALDIVKKYPGRFESWHIKDEIKAAGGNEKYESTLLGQGIVPVKDILAIAKSTAGPTHLIIEQESYQGKTPLDSVQENLKIMSGWGYKN